jgi:hypothetical protein
LAPFNLNCTPLTPTPSEAAADTVTVPETVVPAAGAVSATAGAVVSGAVAVVNVKRGDVDWRPDPSLEATRK